MNKELNNQEGNKALHIGVVGNSAIGKPYKIVCIKPYTFENTEFKLGEISEHSWGRNIPDGWCRATQKDVEDYINRR